MRRRRFLEAILATAGAPAIAQANVLAQVVAGPRPTWNIDNPPHFPPGTTSAERAVWAAAVAQFLAAMGSAVGLDSPRQRVTAIVDERWSSDADRGLVNAVEFTHPLLEMAVHTYQGGARVGLGYRPGLESPLWLTRHPDDVTYSAVFRDATMPTARRLIDRFRWLAGLGDW